MTRRHHSDPLRLDGLDAWITREPEPQHDPAMDEDELEPCATCEATGFVPECRAEDRACTCPNGRCADCNARCPDCGGDRFI